MSPEAYLAIPVCAVVVGYVAEPVVDWLARACAAASRRADERRIWRGGGL